MQDGGYQLRRNLLPHARLNRGVESYCLGFDSTEPFVTGRSSPRGFRRPSLLQRVPGVPILRGATRKRPARSSLRWLPPRETIGRSHARSQPRDTRMRACGHENPEATKERAHPWQPSIDRRAADQWRGLRRDLYSLRATDPPLHQRSRMARTASSSRRAETDYFIGASAFLAGSPALREFIF